MTDPVVLICMPCVEGVYVYPGSIQDTCADCGAKVWVAPSGREWQDKVVLCTDCGLARIEKEKPAEVGLLPKAAEEVKAFKRRN